AVREDLCKCSMSIHLIGRNYSLVPEGAGASLQEIQNELAIERGEQGGFSRLLWIPQGLQVDDPRQRSVIDRVRLDPRVQKGADLLETYLEDLRTVIDDALRTMKAAAAASAAAQARPAEVPAAAASGHLPPAHL